MNTSSSTGIIGLPMTSVYSASKHAVKGLTESSADLEDMVSKFLIYYSVMSTANVEYKSHITNDGMWRLIPSEDG